MSGDFPICRVCGQSVRVAIKSGDRLHRRLKRPSKKYDPARLIAAPHLRGRSVCPGSRQVIRLVNEPPRPRHPDFVDVRRPILRDATRPVASSEFVRKYVLLAEALLELHALSPLDQTFVQQYKDAAGWLYQAMGRLERVEVRDQIDALEGKHRTPWWGICTGCYQEVRVRVAVGSDGILEYRADKHRWGGHRCSGSGKPTEQYSEPPEGL